MEAQGDGELLRVRAVKYDPRTKALFALVLSLALIGGVTIATVSLTVMVRGSTATTAVQWVVPTLKTMTISYPTSLTSVSFTLAAASTAQQAADSQGASGSPAAFRITNTGNVAISISGVFTATLTSQSTGIAEFRIANASSAGAPSTTQIWWCGAATDTGMSPAGSCSGSDNSTTSRVLMNGAQALSASGTHDFWAWTWVTTAAAAGTYTATFQETSS